MPASGPTAPGKPNKGPSVGSVGGHTRPLKWNEKQISHNSINWKKKKTHKDQRERGDPHQGCLEVLQSRGVKVRPGGVKPPLSSPVLRERAQCLLQQEETEGQSTGRLFSCVCVTDVCPSSLPVSLKQTHTHTPEHTFKQELVADDHKEIKSRPPHTRPHVPR